MRPLSVLFDIHIFLQRQKFVLSSPLFMLLRPYCNPDTCVLLNCIEILEGCWLAWLKHLVAYVNYFIGFLVNWKYLYVVSYFCLVCEHVLRPNSQNLTIALHFTCNYKELSAEVKFSISWVLGEIIGLVKVYPSQGFHLTSKFDADKLVTLATILVNRSLCNHQLGELIWPDYLGVLGNLLACSINLYDFYWLFCKVPHSIKRWKFFSFLLNA